MVGDNKLTDRQRRFVEEYLVDCNAARAAVRAGYSPNAAEKAGYRLKKIPAVREALDAAFEVKRQGAEVDRERIIRELARIAFADISEFAAWDERGLSFKEASVLTPEQTACVAEVAESGTGGTKKLRIKLHSKTKAIEALCRLLGLYDEKGKAAGDRIFNIITKAPAPPQSPGAGGQGQAPLAAKPQGEAGEEANERIKGKMAPALSAGARPGR
jgi:phage terminase small subunit